MDMLIIFKIYLIYGLAFFAIFFSILSRDFKNSRIHIASTLPILAVFGLIHGFHEWSDLYLVMYAHEFSLTQNFATFKVIKLWFSLLALGVFAWKMLLLTSWRFVPWIKITIVVVLILFVAGLFFRYGSVSYPMYIQQVSDQIRWIFAFGAGGLSGLAMYSYANLLESEGHGASLPFKLAGISLIGYGMSACWLSVDLGIWVLICRTVCALSLLIALWYALRVFDQERDSQIEAALQQSLQDAKLKELGELTSAVAHEIKTPISSAMVSCDLLARQLPDNMDYQRQIDRIQNGLRRAAEISHEVLNYAHYRPICRETISLSAVIHAAVQLNQFRLNAFEFKLVLNDDLKVAGDSGLLEEVVTNLIANAIDATQDGRSSVSKKPVSNEKPVHNKTIYNKISDDQSITIESFQDKLTAVIRVSDHGGGIPESLLEKVTQPFFTTKPKGEGTGMGLALCKQIVLQHSGELILYNACDKHQQQGLIVEIRLPRKI